MGQSFTEAKDSVLLPVLERVSRAADDGLGRRFYSETDTVLYDGYGGTKLDLRRGQTEKYRSDLISVSTLKIDTTGDGTFDTTLVPDDDYWLYPPNPSTRFEPATRIDIPTSRTTTPAISVWPTAPRRIEIAGKFGYSEETESAGTLGAAISDTTGTSITMTAGHTVDVGDTLIVGTEQMYVSGRAADVLTVVRGINGSTAATHLISAAVSRRVYPADVVEAVIRVAVEVHREMASGFSGEMTGLSEGSMSFRRPPSLISRVRYHLGTYRTEWGLA